MTWPSGVTVSIVLMHVIFFLEISCMKMSSREKFVATIVSPNGQSIQPLFDSRPSIDPKTSRVCQILPGSRTGVHKVEITNLDSCGVQACPQDGQVSKSAALKEKCGFDHFIKDKMSFCELLEFLILNKGLFPEEGGSLSEILLTRWRSPRLVCAIFVD